VICCLLVKNAISTSCFPLYLLSTKRFYYQHTNTSNYYLTKSTNPSNFYPSYLTKHKHFKLSELSDNLLIEHSHKHMHRMQQDVLSTSCTQTLPVISSWLMLDCMGVGAGKFLGVRRIFARILPNLPGKTPKKVTSKKISCHFGRHFFPIKVCRASFLLVFTRVCSYFQGFCESFQRFCPDFRGFSPNQKCARIPCTPAAYTSAWLQGFFKTDPCEAPRLRWAYYFAAKRKAAMLATHSSFCSFSSMALLCKYGHDL